MINGKKILAVITARSGSKRLPEKNITDFCGKPLIYWTVKSALDSKYIDRTLISTDSNLIGKMVENYGCDFPFLRPEELSDDDASSNDVMLHALKWIRDNDPHSYEYALLLQPTSPLRTASHIDQAIEKFNSTPNFSSLISITKIEIKLSWLKAIDTSGNLIDYFPEKIEQRIQADDAYIPNGAIYITEINSFLEDKSFYSGSSTFFIMKQDESIDIDTINDFRLAEFYFRQK